MARGWLTGRLRLFVKLPELLARCHMQREHMTVLVAKLSEVPSPTEPTAASHLSPLSPPLSPRSATLCCWWPCVWRVAEQLLKFLITQKGKYFAAEYEQPDEEYLKWWGNDKE